MWSRKEVKNKIIINIQESYILNKQLISICLLTILLVDSYKRNKGREKVRERDRTGPICEHCIKISTCFGLLGSYVKNGVLVVHGSSPGG